MLLTTLTLAASILATPVDSVRIAQPRGPVIVAEGSRETVLRQIETQRRQAAEQLQQGVLSYLAAVRRVEFGTRATLRVGSAADNEVRLTGKGIRPHHLAVTVRGDSFDVVAVDPAATFAIGQEQPLREARRGPVGLTLGQYTLRLSHQRSPAIIVFDAKSPHLARYRGLDYYAPDLAYRYVLPLTPAPAETVGIGSTNSGERRALRVGWFDFKVGEVACRLSAYRLLEPGVGPNDLAVFFRDATTGKETYSLGRYVDPQRVGGAYLLDFNFAYNPACAFSEFFNCPIPPEENVLPVPILAGEKDPHYPH